MSIATMKASDGAVRVLLIGASGVFGSRLARLLAAERGLSLVLAGRRRGPLDALAGAIRREVARPVEVAVLDRAAIDAAALNALGVSVVVDASGPFQAMDLHVPSAAIAAGVHYVDLADSRAFVAAIPALDAAARAAGVAVLSGASSTPALSHAALDTLCAGWRRIDTVRVTISPSNRQPRGLAVVDAILGGVGQPMTVWRDGRWAEAHGWGETRRVALPGIGRRWASLCETPDIDLLQERYRPRVAAEFLASLELPVMHLSLAAIGLAVRAGWLRSASPLAGALVWLATRLERFGSDWGGMVAEAKGVDGDGRAAQAQWWLRAKGDIGPNVPVLAALAIVRKIRDGTLGWRGAASCAGVLAVEDFEPDFTRLGIETGIAGHLFGEPSFAAALGPAFCGLPAATQAVHSPSPALVLDGEADVEGAAGGIGRMIARRFGFPASGRGVSLRVIIEAEADGGESWTRVYAGRTMRSRMVAADPAQRSVDERFRPFRFTLGLEARTDGLTMRLMRVRLGRWTLPRMLWPRIAAEERAAPGRHLFDVEIGLPAIGRLVRYRGWLAIDGGAAVNSASKRSHQPDRHRNPRRVGDDELTLGRSQRQDVELRTFGADQAAEQEAAGGAGDEDVAVHGAGEGGRGVVGGGVDALAPDFVAGAVVADRARHFDGDESGRGGGGDDDAGLARGVDAVGGEDGGDGDVLAVRQLDEVARGDAERAGDAVEPADRYGARAGFEAADGLRRGRGDTGAGDVVESHLPSAADFADARDHGRLS